MPYLYLWPFIVFSYRNFNFNYHVRFIPFFPGVQIVLGFIHLISDHLRFLGSVDIGGYLEWYILKREFCLLVFFQMFFSGLWIVQVGSVYHNIIWTFQVIGIHEKCKPNYPFLHLAIFPDLKMTQFWPVNYICQVRKVNFLLWTCPDFWTIFIS